MVGGMQKNNGFGYSSKCIDTTFTILEVKCRCKINLKLRMVKSSSNVGNKFYRCSLWHVSDIFYSFQN